MNRQLQIVIGTLAACLSAFPVMLAIKVPRVAGQDITFAGFLMTAVLSIATALVFLIRPGRPYTSRLVSGFVAFWVAVLLVQTWPDFAVKEIGRQLRQVFLGGGVVISTGWFACTGRLPGFVKRYFDPVYEYSE